MTQQKNTDGLKNADPLELAALMHIVSACSFLVTSALNVPALVECLSGKDRKRDFAKWKLKLEELRDAHEDYKRLVKEILLVLNELEPGFGGKQINAGNLLFFTDRSSFYRFLELRRDLAALTGYLAETVDELDKFLVENGFRDFKLDKDDELLAHFDKIMSQWGRGTFNDFARELKALNRTVEKRIGRED
jgi:hypothetical protein